jgi:aspartate racemase
MSKIVGVLGGMGPEATAEFYRHFIEATPAQKDQDHLTVLIYSEPRIPDRTNYLVSDGPSPLPELLRVAKALEGMGAELLALPCNTAHYFWDSIAESVDVPVMNIVKETVSCVAETLGEEIGDRFPRIAVMATLGTLQAGLYEPALEEKQLSSIPVPEQLQQEAMNVISSVKAGEDRSETAARFRHLVQELKVAGADGIILGCTELGLAAGEEGYSVPLFDSLRILAQATVKTAMGRHRR